MHPPTSWPTSIATCHPWELRSRLYWIRDHGKCHQWPGDTDCRETQCTASCPSRKSSVCGMLVVSWLTLVQAQMSESQSCRSRTNGCTIRTITAPPHTVSAACCPQRGWGWGWGWGRSRPRCYPHSDRSPASLFTLAWGQKRRQITDNKTWRREAGEEWDQ